jgi:hypothetical protein
MNFSSEHASTGACCDLRTIYTCSVAVHACGMFENNAMKALLAALLFGYLLAAGPVQAGFMDFSVESLKIEDSGGC